MTRILRLAPAWLLALASAAWAAPDWPTRPVHLVVPLGSGGNADAVARALAKGLSQRLGQPVVVENRPGAAGNIGMEHAARAVGDGHTLLFAVTAIAINPSLYKVRYDPLADLVPVAQLNRVFLAVMARKDLAADDPAGLLAYIRARPGKVSCASTGGATQLGCLQLQAGAGVPMVQVLYKGPVPALTDLSSAQVDVLVDIPATARPFVEAQRIKAIGTSAPQDQLSVLGVLRSMSAAVPGFVLPGFHGVFAPAGTPPDVVARLNREINEALRDPGLSRLMLDNGLEPIGGPPSVLGDRLREDLARYRQIAQSAGIVPE
jgi:tripartite-type tricarboxylate transporter receptor subunit TctC